MLYTVPGNVVDEVLPLRDRNERELPMDRRCHQKWRSPMSDITAFGSNRHEDLAVQQLGPLALLQLVRWPAGATRPALPNELQDGTA